MPSWIPPWLQAALQTLLVACLGGAGVKIFEAWYAGKKKAQEELEGLKIGADHELQAERFRLKAVEIEKEDKLQGRLLEMWQLQAARTDKLQAAYDQVAAVVVELQKQGLELKNENLKLTGMLELEKAGCRERIDALEAETKDCQKRNEWLEGRVAQLEVRTV